MIITADKQEVEKAKEEFLEQMETKLEDYELDIVKRHFAEFCEKLGI